MSYILSIKLFDEIQSFMVWQLYDISMKYISKMSIQKKKKNDFLSIIIYRFISNFHTLENLRFYYIMVNTMFCEIN